MFVMIDKSDGRWFARLHDGHGNFSIYEVPQNCDQNYEAVQTWGTCVSTKKKGDVFRLTDGQKDKRYLLYNMLRAIEPTVKEPEVVAEAETEVESQPEPTIKKLKYKNTSTKIDVFFSPPGIYPSAYVERETPCADCGTPIRMRAAVTLKGKVVDRININTPVDKAATRLDGTWKCGGCATGEKPKSAEQSEPELTHTSNGFSFVKRDGVWYYAGNRIQGDGVKFFISQRPCVDCGQPISFRSTVSFRDGLPHNVAPYKCVDKVQSQPIKPSSSKWHHLRCPKVKQEAPTPPIETPAAPEPPIETPAAPEPPIETPAAPNNPEGKGVIDTKPVLNLLGELERITCDNSYGDEFVRGATWAVLRLLRGGE